jgi:hypothetical protein
MQGEAPSQPPMAQQQPQQLPPGYEIKKKVICADCLAWFDKRRAVSGSFPKVERT